MPASFNESKIVFLQPYLALSASEPLAPGAAEPEPPVTMFTEFLPKTDTFALALRGRALFSFLRRTMPSSQISLVTWLPLLKASSFESKSWTKGMPESPSATIGRLPPKTLSIKELYFCVAIALAAIKTPTKTTVVAAQAMTRGFNNFFAIPIIVTY